MSAATFNSVTYNDLSFTNISATETATGLYAPFIGPGASVNGVASVVGSGLQFGAFSAGAYYANSSDILNLTYTISTNSPTLAIGSMSQLYTTDLDSGPGVHLTAQETVYDMLGNVVATDTYELRGNNVPYILFSHAEQTVIVRLTVSMWIDATGSPVGSPAGLDISAITISGIQQTFGTIPAPTGMLPLPTGAIPTGSSALAATIGTIVWLDSDGDGLLDNGEAGVQGVTVELLSDTGSVVATTTTDISGNYVFNVAAGTYQVLVLAPPNETFTAPNGIATASQTSSAVDASGLSGVFTVTGGQVYTDANAGLVPPTGAIGSTVWLDANRDGILDNGETGVANVTVELLNASSGAIIRTTATDALGHYAFNGLTAGAYAVQILAPANESFTASNVATQGGINSNVNTTGLSAPVTLAPGGTGTVNAGLVLPTGSIGSTVWLDLNNDGLLDNGETGVANVTVELLNPTNGAILGTTATDASGHYVFDGLTAGSYQVAFLAPAADGFTRQGVGGNQAINSSANIATGVTGPITLAAGMTYNNANAGLAKAALGDRVWRDANRNGVQDTGETGIGGVSVKLLAADTLVLKIAEDGYQGDAQYTISVNGLQIGGTRAVTAAHAGGLDSIVTLTGDFGTNPAVVVTFLNAIVGSSAATSRKLYVDGITYNGITQTASAALRNSGPRNFALTGAGEIVLATTTTNSAGSYAFNNLNAGSYEVMFAASAGDGFTSQNAGTNAAVDSNANQATGITAPVTLIAGQVDNTIDAGLVSASGISVLKQPCSMVVNQCGQITYSFQVANTGMTPLTNLRITDNIGSAANPDTVTPTAILGCNGANIGDSNRNGLLDAGETWQYTETVSQISCTTGSSGSVCHTATGSNLSAGCTAWLHSSFNPTSCSDGTTYKFQGVTCTITGGGVGSKPITVPCPDSQVTFSRACTQPSTVYDSATNCWVTTLPANSNPGSVFLSGCPLVIPSNCNLNNATVTWSIDDGANTCGASSLVWDGGCTGFQSFSQNGYNGTANYNQIGVKSCDNMAGYGSGGSVPCGSPGWKGGGSDTAGTPENLHVGTNCGTTTNSASYGQSAGLCSFNRAPQQTGSSCGGSGSAAQNGTNIAGAADTVTVTAQSVTGTSSGGAGCGGIGAVIQTGATVSATDTKEVQVLGRNSNVSVNGTATASSLSAIYGTAQTLELAYAPGNTVSLKQVQAGLATVSGTNSASLAFIEITNNANPTAPGASIYFAGAVTNGGKIYADATTNVLTNTPIAGGHFSSVAGADIYAFVFSSQEAFNLGAAPVQTMAYNTSGSQAMHFGDIFGSLSVVGYVGSTGGRLSS